MSYILSFLAFFWVLSATLFGSHLFLYMSLRHFFVLWDVTKMITIITLIALSLSFLVSSILAHWYDNIFTRGFYYVSASWLGVLSNAFFIFAICWLIWGVLSRLGMSIPLAYIGGGAIAMIIASSAYGIINAASPVIREDTVYIQNLPSAWEGKKIVQINDVHLGHIIRSNFAKQIVEMTKGIKNLGAVFIVGDLFDGMDGHLEGLLGPFNGFRSEYGTYFITGNHETYLGTSKTLDIIKTTNIHIIENTLVDVEGVQIIGVASPEPGASQDIASIMKQVGFDNTKPSIVLYHTPTHIDTFRKLGVSLQLAGHTHRGQMYPYNLITKAIFRGYDFWVFHEWNYTLSVSSGVGTWWPPMRTNSHAEIVVLKLTGQKLR